MKIIVAVDETDRYQSVLNFISALKLPGVQIRFVHVVAPLVGYDGAYTAIAAINDEDIYTATREAETGRLQEACREAECLNIPATWRLGFGFPTSVLDDQANIFAADIIGLASSPKGPFERLVSGSVALSVAENSGHNLLIVRSDDAKWGEINAVYASDHSEISRECLNELLGWNPGGIAQVEVLTAFELVGKEMAFAGRNQVVSGTEVDSAIKSLLQARTDGIAKCFRQAGISAHAKCLECSAIDAIHQTLHATDGKLLILASKEHSFWSNTFGAGTSQKEIKTEPCSLLILRPPKTVTTAAVILRSEKATA